MNTCLRRYLCTHIYEKVSEWRDVYLNRNTRANISTHMHANAGASKLNMHVTMNVDVNTKNCVNPYTDI